MQKANSRFCRIVCFDEQDFSRLETEYDKYQVSVERFSSVETNPEVPTLLMGWGKVKSLYPDSRISKKKLYARVFWTFSEAEDSAQQKKDVEKFLQKSLREFLPKDYVALDCCIDGNIVEKTDSIFSEQGTFCYFGNNGSLYVYGPKGFYGINLKSIDYSGMDTNEFIRTVTERYSPTFFSFDNLPDCLKSEECSPKTLENISWICSNQFISETALYKFSPFVSKEKEMVFFMSKLNDNIDCNLSSDKKISDRYNRKDIITDWLSRQTIHFDDGKELMLKYSNKRTITGRINCVDRRFNPQHLPKKSEERNRINSRFDRGSIGVFDFVSFETRLSVILTKDSEFIKSFSDSDLHTETAKVIYGKKSVTENERSVGKQINHSIIYGIGNDRLNAFMSENGLGQEKVKDVRKLLKPIIENAKRVNEDFKKKGYIVNPYNSVVYPQKEWAVYNNYVQSIAADLVIEKLFLIKRLLHGMNTKFMFQVYDSFVFDIHPEEIFLVDKIRTTLQKSGNYNFDVECVTGKTLMDCTVQKESEEMTLSD